MSNMIYWMWAGMEFRDAPVKKQNGAQLHKTYGAFTEALRRRRDEKRVELLLVDPDRAPMPFSRTQDQVKEKFHQLKQRFHKINDQSHRSGMGHNKATDTALFKKMKDVFGRDPQAIPDARLDSHGGFGTMDSFDEEDGGEEINSPTTAPECSATPDQITRGLKSNTASGKGSQSMRGTKRKPHLTAELEGQSAKVTKLDPNDKGQLIRSRRSALEKKQQEGGSAFNATVYQISKAMTEATKSSNETILTGVRESNSAFERFGNNFAEKMSGPAMIKLYVESEMPLQQAIIPIE